MAAVVRSWWLTGLIGERLVEQTATELHRTQARVLQAQASHTKATMQKLEALGIRLDELPRCAWDGM